MVRLPDIGKQLGGRTEAVLLSMTGICKRPCIEPFLYLADGLRRLPTTNRLTELLPPTSGSRSTRC
jgi:hypothetical protein